MNALVELADNVAQYNLIGKIKLPMIKLAIVQTNNQEAKAIKIIKDLGCHEAKSFAKIMGIGGCQAFRSENIYNL
jgi:hypothetical protein